MLEKTAHAGIASFVMHDREYVVAILGEAGILRAQTLRFVGEVRSIDELGLNPKPVVDRRLQARLQTRDQSDKPARAWISPSSRTVTRSAWRSSRTRSDNMAKT